MRTEGVAQGVGVDVGGESAEDGYALDDAGDGARGEAGTARRGRGDDCVFSVEAAEAAIEEEGGHVARGFVECGSEECGAFGEVFAERECRGIAEWDVALLLALAADEE